MKKYITLLLVLILLPIGVFAKTCDTSKIKNHHLGCYYGRVFTECED